MRLVKVVSGAALLLAACAPGESGNRSSRFVGPAGDSVAVPDRTAAVNIGAGALPREIEITVAEVPTPTNAPPPFGLRVVSKVYAFLPHGTAFATPVTITLNYPATVGHPVILRRDHGADLDWDVLAPTTAAFGVATVQVPSFSELCVAEPDPGAPPDPAPDAGSDDAEMDAATDAPAPTPDGGVDAYVPPDAAPDLAAGNDAPAAPDVAPDLAVEPDTAPDGPPPPASVLFLVAERSFLNPGETALHARMLATGMQVTLANAATATAASAVGKDLIIVSDSVSIAALATKFRDEPVPALVLASHALGNMAMTDTVSGAEFGRSAGVAGLSILAGGHPIAGGRSGAVTIAAPADFAGWGAPRVGAIRVAEAAEKPGKHVLFSYETGAQMYQRVAPARRVFFGLTSGLAARLTGEGLALFDSAAAWAMGRTPPPPPPPPDGGAPDDAGAGDAGPPSRGNLLFVVANPGALSLGEEAIHFRLADRGYAVTLVDDNLVTEADAAGMKAVIMSKNAGIVAGTTFRLTQVPVVVMNESFLPLMNMTGSSSGVDYGFVSTANAIDIQLAGHPMSALLLNRVEIAFSPAPIGWGVPNNEAAKVGSIALQQAQMALFGYVTGKMMFGLVAPAARGFYGPWSATAADLTAEGIAILDAIVDWAVNNGTI